MISVASNVSGCMDAPPYLDAVRPPECSWHALAVGGALAAEPVDPAEQHNLRMQLELGKEAQLHLEEGRVQP